MIYSLDDKFNFIQNGYEYLQEKNLQINNNTKIIEKYFDNKEIDSIIGDMNKIMENYVKYENAKEIPNKEVNINFTKEKKDKNESIIINENSKKKKILIIIKKIWEKAI